MGSRRTILELARAIIADAETCDRYLIENNLPQPTFNSTGPASPPAIDEPTVVKAHERLRTASRELHNLTLGPTGCIRQLSQPEDLFSTAVIGHFAIAQHVPIDGEISFMDLASKTKLPVQDLTRIMRYAMTNFLFSEPRAGFVAHSASSRLLAENALAQGMVMMGCGERFLAAAKHVEALQEFPGSEEPTLSGWGLANNAQAPFFEELALRHVERAAKVSQTMGALAKLNRAEDVVEMYDWAALGNAHVIDIGGGNGTVSIALARRFPELSFTIQDLPAVVESARSGLPADLNDRITFMEHDFFLEQPVKGGDVYLFRYILHDWPDKYAVRILRALVQALKPGSRVFLIEPYMPDNGTMTLWEERSARVADLRIMIFMNGRDREAKDWEALYAAADSRFRFQNKHLLPSTDANIGRTSNALFEAKWVPL